jgi:hypothetical protein
MQTTWYYVILALGRYHISLKHLRKPPLHLCTASGHQLHAAPNPVSKLRAQHRATVPPPTLHPVIATHEARNTFHPPKPPGIAGNATRGSPKPHHQNGRQQNTQHVPDSSAEGRNFRAAEWTELAILAREVGLRWLCSSGVR